MIPKTIKTGIAVPITTANVALTINHISPLRLLFIVVKFLLSCRILPTLKRAVSKILYKLRFHNTQSYHRVYKDVSVFLRHSSLRLHLEEQHPRNNRSPTTLGCSVNRITRFLLPTPFREQRSSVVNYERAKLLTAKSAEVWWKTANFTRLSVSIPQM